MKSILRASIWLMILTTSFINGYAAMTPTPTAAPTPAASATTTSTPESTPAPATNSAAPTPAPTSNPTSVEAAPAAPTTPAVAPVASDSSSWAVTPVATATTAATSDITPSPAASQVVTPAATTPSATQITIPPAQQKDVKLGRDYREIMADRQQKLKSQQQRMQQAHQQSVAARASARATGPVPQQSIQQYYQAQQDAKVAQQYGAWSPQSVSARQAQDYAGVQTSAPKPTAVKKPAAPTTTPVSSQGAVNTKNTQVQKPGAVQKNTAPTQKQAQEQKTFRGKLPAQRMQRKAWRPAVRQRKTAQPAPAKATNQTVQKSATQTTGIKPLPVSE